MLSHCRPLVDAGGRSPKTQIDLARFQGAKLFRRGHIKEVQHNVWGTLAEVPKRFGEQLEVKGLR